MSIHNPLLQSTLPITSNNPNIHRTNQILSSRQITKQFLSNNVSLAKWHQQEKNVHPVSVHQKITESQRNRIENQSYNTITKICPPLRDTTSFRSLFCQIFTITKRHWNRVRKESSIVKFFSSFQICIPASNTWLSNDSTRVDVAKYNPRWRRGIEREEEEDERASTAIEDKTFDRRNTHAVWGRVHKCHRVEARVGLMLGLARATPVKRHPHQLVVAHCARP